jgi:hypothetical protein
LKRIKKPLFFIAVLLSFLLWVLPAMPLSAQESGSSPPARFERGSRINPPSALIGYGLVNNWFRIDPSELGELLSRNGLTLTGIEYVPWLDEEGRKGLSLRTDVEAAKRFVKVMRTYHITTLISVVNWNTEAPRKASTEWFLDRVREIRDQIGTNQVLLLPVSEPDRSNKSREWQELALKEWPGGKVLNGPGGRGRPMISERADYLDWHWCSDFDQSTIKTTEDGFEVINNTDCTPVINPGPTRAAKMTRAALDKKAHFLVYDFDGVKIDEQVIQAMGAAIQRAFP